MAHSVVGDRRCYSFPRFQQLGESPWRSHYQLQGLSKTPLQLTEYAHDGIFLGDSRLLTWAEVRSRASFLEPRPRTVLDDSAHKDPRRSLMYSVNSAAWHARPHLPRIANRSRTSAHRGRSGQRADTGIEVTFVCAPPSSASGPAAQRSVPSRLLGRAPGECSLSAARTSILRPATQPATRHLSWNACPGRRTQAPSPRPEREITRAAAAVDSHLLAGDRPVLATPRTRPDVTKSLEAGGRIAVRLAHVLRAMASTPSVVVAKGGTTSP